MRENFQRRSFAMSEVTMREIKYVDYEVETHPFEPFIDEKTRVLIVGTFPPRRFAVNDLDQKDVNWFYGSKDNAFWDLLGEVLGQEFSKDVIARKEQCEKLEIGFVDLFYKVERYDRDWSTDDAIHPLKIRSLSYIIENNPQIKGILFTSTLTEKIAKKEYLKENRQKLLDEKKPTSYVGGGIFCRFQGTKEPVKILTLPSPSPMNTDDFKSKKKKWQEIFSEIGIQIKD